jgi:hypothetical protein
MEVRVVCAQPTSSCPETDYVHVHTYSDPFDETVTLATIERVVEKPLGAPTLRSRIAKRVKTLIMRQRMSPDDALEVARRYAEHKQISVVYADQG